MTRTEQEHSGFWPEYQQILPDQSVQSTHLLYARDHVTTYSNTIADTNTTHFNTKSHDHAYDSISTVFSSSNSIDYH
jgi:hypothetical protein